MSGNRREKGFAGDAAPLIFSADKDLFRLRSVILPESFLIGTLLTDSDKGQIFRLKCPYEERASMKRSGTLTFGLFVIVVLAAIFWLMHGRGQTQWGLVAVLVGVLALRVALFVINLRQQRHNAERGKGSVKIETRLGLGDEGESTEPPTEPPAPSTGASQR
jgi:hypothetical protein